MQAPAPERLIKGGMPTEAMVASVLVAKYAWHLPLYRQSRMLAAQGLDIKRSVLAFWVGYAAAELEPLYLRLRQLILGSGKIAVDETKAPVLDPGRGRVKNGYFWAIARDDRPWGGTDPPAIAFTYAPGRGAVHALKLLDGYRGVVQCDGYAAYKKIAAEAPGEPITLAFCWSHLRATVLRARQERQCANRQRSARTHRRALCDRDDDPGTSAEERRRVRRERSKPLVEALRTWLERQLARVSAKATIAEDLRYGLNHWDGLVSFPRRRPHRARHQHRRTRNQADGSQSKKCALRRPRRRGRELGLRRLADRRLCSVDGLRGARVLLAALTLGRRRACVRPTICGRSRWP